MALLLVRSFRGGSSRSLFGSRFLPHAMGTRFASSVALIKELRTRTGAAVVDCKRALDSNDGDVEKAVAQLADEARARGEEVASSAAGGSQGRVVAWASSSSSSCAGALVQLTCSTDFVARNDEFKEAAEGIAQAVGQWVGKSSGGGAFRAVEIGQGGEWSESESAKTVKDMLSDMNYRTGEPIALANGVAVEASDVDGKTVSLGTYVHGHGKYAALVAVQGHGSDRASLESIGRELAIHVVASSPTSIAGGAESSGEEPSALLEQPFALDEEHSVASWLALKGGASTINVTGFVRLKMGEEPSVVSE